MNGRDALALAEIFLGAVRRADTPGAVETLLDSVARELGFRHYALLHRGDLRGVRATTSGDDGGRVLLHNYPGAWAERYLARRLDLVDPVVDACQTAGGAFAWSELADLVTLDAAYRSFLAEGARAGIADGLTVPVFVPGARSGSCSFAAPMRPGLAEERLAAAFLVGGFAFRRVTDLMRGGPAVPCRRSALPPRLRQCAIFAGQGKSNGDIATILTLRPATVKTYVETACGLYGVHSRAQLVVEALYCGELDFADLRPRQHRHLAT